MSMPANSAPGAGASRKAIAVLCAALAFGSLQLSGCTTPATPATPAAPTAQATATQAARPAEQALPSWRDGAARQALLKFVADVTSPGSPSFVPPEARVAVFDNDGTLWSEQPLYFQFYFLLDQVRAAAPQHPEWRSNAAFKALMANDMDALMANQKQLLGLIATANSGMSVDEYDRTIRDWLAKARHPKFNRPYTEPGLPAASSNCCPTCAPTASRPTSCPAAPSISCGPGASRSTASRPSR